MRYAWSKLYYIWDFYLNRSLHYLTQKKYEVDENEAVAVPKLIMVMANPSTEKTQI